MDRQLRVVPLPITAEQKCRFLARHVSGSPKKPFTDIIALCFCSRSIEKSHQLIYNTIKTMAGEDYEIDICIRFI